MSVLYPNVSRLITTYYKAIGEELLRLFKPKEINIEILYAKLEYLGITITIKVGLYY